MKPVLTDAVKTEMRIAQLMAQQQASGFRFDVTAAERVRSDLSRSKPTSSANFAISIAITQARFSPLSEPTRSLVTSRVLQ